MGIDNNWARIPIINAENFNVLLWGKVTPYIALKFRNILLKFFTSEFLFTYLFILGDPPWSPSYYGPEKKRFFIQNLSQRGKEAVFSLWENQVLLFCSMHMFCSRNAIANKSFWKLFLVKFFIYRRNHWKFFSKIAVPEVVGNCETSGMQLKFR